jgi:hypothetical protein
MKSWLMGHLQCAVAHRIERPEDENARPRQQWRDQFKGWVLGGRADEHDGAVFHYRQEGILLGAIETVNLVDEQQCALPDLAPQPCRVEDFLQIGNAGKDRRDLLEIEFGRTRKEARYRGFSGAGRTCRDGACQPTAGARSDRDQRPLRGSEHSFSGANSSDASLPSPHHFRGYSDIRERRPTGSPIRTLI